MARLLMSELISIDFDLFGGGTSVPRLGCRKPNDIRPQIDFKQLDSPRTRAMPVACDIPWSVCSTDNMSGDIPHLLKLAWPGIWLLGAGNAPAGRGGSDGASVAMTSLTRCSFA
jgi:hypothetical protein